MRIVLHLEFHVCRSGFAQAGRQFSVLTYDEYAPRVKLAVALLDELFCTDPEASDVQRLFDEICPLISLVFNTLLLSESRVTLMSCGICV